MNKELQQRRRGLTIDLYAEAIHTQLTNANLSSCLNDLAPPFCPDLSIFDVNFSLHIHFMSPSHQVHIQ